MAKRSNVCNEVQKNINVIQQLLCNLHKKLNPLGANDLKVMPCLNSTIKNRCIYKNAADGLSGEMRE